MSAAAPCMHLEPAAATPLSSPFFFPSTPSFPSLLSLLVKKKGATGWPNLALIHDQRLYGHVTCELVGSTVWPHTAQLLFHELGQTSLLKGKGAY